MFKGRAKAEQWAARQEKSKVVKKVLIEPDAAPSRLRVRILTFSYSQVEGPTQYNPQRILAIITQLLSLREWRNWQTRKT